MDLLHIVGYVGSFLVALSLTMNNLLRLRWINLFGASTFACYGYFIEAYPVLILNGFITLTDIFYLARMYRQKEYFDLLWIQDTKSPFLHRFLKFYMEDALKYFPGFELTDKKGVLVLFVMRNLKPAGLFIGHVEHNVCHVQIDYVTPEYRDMKSGKFLMEEKRPFFRDRGIDTVVSRAFSPDHERYLQKIGFQRISAVDPKHYTIKLDH